MSDDISVMIVSSPDHERVVAEIYYKDKYVALISQENQNQKIIEFPGNNLVESQICRNISLKYFQKGLEKAIQRLDED